MAEIKINIGGGSSVQLTDNSEQVLSQLDANKRAALLALGTKAVGLIVEQMETGYHTPHKNRKSFVQKVRPGEKKYINVFGQKLKNDNYYMDSDGTHTAIRDTGELMRDVSYEVERSGKDTVDVGNSLEYGIFIHEGTSRLESRPYIRDALNNGADALEKVTAGFFPARCIFSNRYFFAGTV